MTENIIDKANNLIALSEAATPGPWMWHEFTNPANAGEVWIDTMAALPNDRSSAIAEVHSGEDGDAAVIATARNDGPEIAQALLVALEALRKVATVGHNNDCIFCGFKDREVLIARRTLEITPLEELRHELGIEVGDE